MAALSPLSAALKLLETRMADSALRTLPSDTMAMTEDNEATIAKKIMARTEDTPRRCVLL
jgi:signal transduction histidine kinase